MKSHIFYTAGNTQALNHCLHYLQRAGCQILTSPDSTVTDLLLPVPSFNDAGQLHGGDDLSDILGQLPKDITIYGGNLKHPGLAGYKTVDLLEDPLYLAENAAITAHCAVKWALQMLPVTLQQLPVLVIGWGRIGKCLAALLLQMGARVSIYARKDSDRAIATALGYDTADITPPAYDLMRYRVIFNTVPKMLLPEELMQNCMEGSVKIDLASIAGMAGEDVIPARGLPNKDAPESSGNLIGRTVLRLSAGKDNAV